MMCDSARDCEHLSNGLFPPFAAAEEPASDCSHPPNPGANALLMSSTEITASYACRDFSYMQNDGQAVIQCVDEQWQGDPMSCRRKQELPTRTHRLMLADMTPHRVRLDSKGKGKLARAPSAHITT